MEEMKCPVTGHSAKSFVKDVKTSKEGTSNQDWWPNKLNLKILSQNSDKVNPQDKDFNYKEAFLSLDLEEVKKDLFHLMTDSQDWWPADYGHYGPFFIRMAWHSAGTYRTGDGRGGANTGNQRFAPLNSWPDNVNLDKARRLLWPIKQKYGNKISWADLMILAGNCAFESMGLKMIGFAGGREDIWEPEIDTYWGNEKKWLEDTRHDDKNHLESPLAAVQMGLIYVNPEGPNGVPSAVASGKDIRVTFARMGMDDEETVALVAGGHTFGKCHGAASASFVGENPEGASIEELGLGWSSSYKSGKGADTISSGIEGAWTPTPITWDNSYFETLYKYDWDLVKSPAGAWQWIPTDPEARKTVPDAHIEGKTSAPMMTTADMALRMDPIYGKISKRFLDHPEEFEKAFARAWFKLTHRDMGPNTRYLGKDVPKETFIWQDPVPKHEGAYLSEENVAAIKEMLKNASLDSRELVKIAWASASTFRKSDFRGGANGARITLNPQRNWEVNEPKVLDRVLPILEKIKDEWNTKEDAELSMADLIVIAGSFGIEEAARKAGVDLKINTTVGRTDAKQEETDAHSFGVLEPVYDGFRNYEKYKFTLPSEELLLDKAQLLGLTAKEMTVLLGGLRSININFNNSKDGVLTDNEGALTNDFFVNLLSMDTRWEKDAENAGHYLGFDRKNNALKYTATRVDLIFGSNTELRAISEIYAQADGKDKFYRDFAKVWEKVMNADRYDLN